jgi:hypothetical protein
MSNIYNLHEMKLHTELNFNNFTILRVPGGWLYLYYNVNTCVVFVPFNNEFQENQPDVELSDRII